MKLRMFKWHILGVIYNYILVALNRLGYFNDRAIDLQRIGGRVIELPGKEWMTIAA
jgi:hypothetical protein